MIGSGNVCALECFGRSVQTTVRIAGDGTGFAVDGKSLTGQGDCVVHSPVTGAQMQRIQGAGHLSAVAAEKTADQVPAAEGCRKNPDGFLCDRCVQGFCFDIKEGAVKYDQLIRVVGLIPVIGTVAAVNAVFGCNQFRLRKCIRRAVVAVIEAVVAAVAPVCSGGAAAEGWSVPQPFSSSAAAQSVSILCFIRDHLP